jgi:hypothetical protein
MIKKLFLAHHSRYREEVHYVAAELRLRGVVPWVDKDGGFEVADECEPEARRAIRHDCFGLMLYATRSSFDRWFITNVELDEAGKVYKEAKANGGMFDLFAVPRSIGYGYLGKKTQGLIGVNIARMNTVSIPAGAGLDAWRYKTPQAAEKARRTFAERCEKLASELAHRVIRRASESGDKARISLQFRTRQEEMPDKPEDVLYINAAPLFAQGVSDESQWGRLARGLLDIRRHIAASYARPRIHVHGSKHTTAAFLFGRVFARYDLDIQQKPPSQPEPVWASDILDPGGEPFVVAVRTPALPSGVQPQGRALFVEVAVGHKDVPVAVDEFVKATGLRPAVRLQLRPNTPPLDVDNALCRAMVRQTYTEVEKAVRDYQPTDIHLFTAAHLSYTMMLGREFRGMPPVHLYEWDGNQYVQRTVSPQAFRLRLIGGAL